ncbi:unnamed protein product [Penicillium viridicatum]
MHWEIQSHHPRHALQVENLISFKHLKSALSVFHHASADFDAKAESLAGELADRRQLRWYHWHNRKTLHDQVRSVNKRYKHLDRHFLHPQGWENTIANQLYHAAAFLKVD